MPLNRGLITRLHTRVKSNENWRLASLLCPLPFPTKFSDPAEGVGTLWSPTTDDQCMSYSIVSYSNNYIYYDNFQNHTLSLGVQSILHLKGINLKLKIFHQYPSDFSCFPHSLHHLHHLNLAYDLFHFFFFWQYLSWTEDDAYKLRGRAYIYTCTLIDVKEEIKLGEHSASMSSFKKKFKKVVRTQVQLLKNKISQPLMGVEGLQIIFSE